MDNNNKAPAVNINASLHNRFDIEVIDAATGEVKQKAQAFNVICNQLWTRMLQGSTIYSYFKYIHYGTGSGTPSANDTGLFTFLGQDAAVDDGYNLDFAAGIYYLRRRIQLAPETAVGATLTEVGIGYGTGSGTLCTHAMLQDMNGNPISITKTATDVINIYATVYVHFNPQGYGGIYPVKAYGSDIYSLFRVLAGTTGSTGDTAYGGGTSYGAGIGTTHASVENTLSANAQQKQIVISANRLGVSAGNYGGLRDIYVSIYVSSNGTRELMLIPGGSWYPYSTVTNEAVGTGDGSTTDFSLDFPFAHNAVFYVDGVEQNGVTVDYAPNTTDFSAHLIPCESSTVFWPRSRDYSIGNTAIYYNPAYVVGLSSLYVSAGNIDASDDLQTWTNLGSRNSYGTFSIPAEHQNHKYYRFNFYRNTNFATASASFTGNVVHFSSAPANGAVITANYQTDSIAKDSDHVFDLTVTLQLGEYTE